MAYASAYRVIVIGGGHAGAEAAWAAANMLAQESREPGVGKSGRGTPSVSSRVALVTMDPSKIGAMSCNPAIGGLAKGQIVREVDALGGVMGLAADAAGIQFRVLNASKGPAVRGPRCQCDKYAYAREVQRLLRTRPNLDILAGTVERFLVDDGRVIGVLYKPQPGDGPAVPSADCCGEFGSVDDAEKPLRLFAPSVVLTTGTFMRGLMHTGDTTSEGGRVGEAPAVGISAELKRLGFELGRLKTGTPPRLDARTIDFDQLEVQPGDAVPRPFSEMTCAESRKTEGGSPKARKVGRWKTEAGSGEGSGRDGISDFRLPPPDFPNLPQRPCHITHTHAAIHQRIADNLDRAPMYNGQIDAAATGPRYCPSIEDKVVRFADRGAHHVFLEPESLETNEIYCNGISTSLPRDVQDFIVANLPGCEHAKILRYGYAVEYDMVRPHQIDATCMTKRLPGLLLAGQINGTTGYEEAAGQGVIAGINAVRHGRGEPLIRLGRDQAYIGVLLDDLVTKTPLEPYRMFTSRAEHRLLLRSDNADQRLTPLGRELGLVDDARWAVYEAKRAALAKLEQVGRDHRVDGLAMERWWPRAGGDADAVIAALPQGLAARCYDRSVVQRLLADRQYAGYIQRQRREVARLANQESAPLPRSYDYRSVRGLRAEAAQRLNDFQPATLGQARRLEGVNPSDLMLVSLAVRGR